MKSIFDITGGFDNLVILVIIVGLFIFIARCWNDFIKGALSENGGTVGSSSRLNNFLFALLFILVVLIGVLKGKHIDDNILFALCAALGIGNGAKVLKDIMQKGNNSNNSAS
jgi:hypothetical protein